MHQRFIAAPRQSEIDDLQPPFGRDDGVGRLEVAVNHVAVVGIHEGLGRLHTEPQSLLERQLPLVEPLPQRATFDVLHRDERRTVCVAHLVDRANVWMIQGGCVAGLAQQPRPRRLDIGRVHHFQGHIAMERRVVGEEHRAHSATAQQPFHSVAAERHAGGNPGGGVRVEWSEVCGHQSAMQDATLRDYRAKVLDGQPPLVSSGRRLPR